MAEQDRLITLKEAALILGISKRTLWRERRAGHLPTSSPRGVGHYKRVWLSDVVKLAKSWALDRPKEVA